MAQQSVEDSVDAAAVQSEGDEVSDMAQQSVEDSVNAAAVQPQGDEVSDMAQQSVEDSVDAAAVQPEGDEVSDMAQQSVEDSVDAAAVDLEGEERPGKQGIELSTPEQSLAGDDISVHEAALEDKLKKLVESVKTKVESLKQKGNNIVKTDPAGAIKWYKDALHDISGGERSVDIQEAFRPLLVQLNCNIALACLKLQDWGKAVVHCEAALLWDPDNPKAHIRLATALTELEQYEKARDHFRRMLEKQPKEANAGLERLSSSFRKLADQGDAAAQLRLGSCYEFGEGATQDMARAAEWYQKSAKQGNAAAQFRLGSHYAAGVGVGQDRGRAVEWYEKSAEQARSSSAAQLKGPESWPQRQARSRPRPPRGGASSAASRPSSAFWSLV